MLQEFKINDFFILIGKYANTPIIKLIRENVNSVFGSKGTQDADFRVLMHRLEIAERKGVSNQTRLEQEINEYAEILDDESKSRLYVIGNSSISEVYSQISDGDNSMMDVLKDLKHNFEDEEIDDSDVIIQEFNNIYKFQDPEYLQSIEERVSPEVKLLMQKSITELSSKEMMQITLAVCGFSDNFIKSTRKLFKEILLVHSQMEYYQRIVDYRDENFSINESEDNPTDKKISIPYPKVTRSPNDKITSLTSNQTTYLFSLLRGHGIIIKEKNYQPASNISLAIKAITGYNEQNIRAYLDKVENTDKYDKIVVKEKVEDLLKLINRHLQ